MNLAELKMFCENLLQPDNPNNYIIARLNKYPKQQQLSSEKVKLSSQ
jgi:hypothetical protein